MKIGIKEILFLGLLIAIPVLSYFQVFKKNDARLAQQQQELQTKEQKLSQLVKAADQIEDLEHEIDSLGNALQFFEDKLPDQHEIHKVLEQVTHIADDKMLDTRLFKTGAPNPWANYYEQPIEMEVYGNFDAFYQFLLDLEKLPRITRVKELVLKKDSKHEGNTNVEMTISIFFNK